MLVKIKKDKNNEWSKENTQKIFQAASTNCVDSLKKVGIPIKYAQIIIISRSSKESILLADDFREKDVSEEELVLGYIYHKKHIKKLEKSLEDRWSRYLRYLAYTLIVISLSVVIWKKFF